MGTSWDKAGVFCNNHAATIDYPGRGNSSRTPRARPRRVVAFGSRILYREAAVPSTVAPGSGRPRPGAQEAPMRPSRRQPDELRAVTLERAVVKHAEGSCFVKFGDTHVLVVATLEDKLPPWLKGQGRGWVT